MVGLQSLDLPIGVRIPVSQPKISRESGVESRKWFSLDSRLPTPDSYGRLA